MILLENNTAKKEKDFDRDYQMLNYFQDEFLYRHKHFWNFGVKSFLLTMTITIIPIANEIFGLTFSDMISSFLLVFPAIGMTLAIGSFFIMLDECKKMEAVNAAKYRINRNMDEKYQYIFYNNFSESKFCDKHNKIKYSLARSLTVMFFILEITVIVIVAIILLG